MNRDGVLMIEGESDFVGEEDMMRAIEVGHAAVRDLCLGDRFSRHVVVVSERSQVCERCNLRSFVEKKKKLLCFSVRCRSSRMCEWVFVFLLWKRSPRRLRRRRASVFLCQQQGSMRWQEPRGVLPHCRLRLLCFVFRRLFSCSAVVLRKMIT